MHTTSAFRAETWAAPLSPATPSRVLMWDAPVRVFRLVWGLVGTRRARFASFLRGPAAVLASVRGLDGGADDHVVKLVDLDKLAARLRAVVRRSHGQPRDQRSAQDVVLDPVAWPPSRDGPWGSL